MKTTWKNYLKTFRRVPDDVILRMATREFDMEHNSYCVCGWVMRETLANGIAAEDIAPTAIMNSSIMSQEKYGGTIEEWDAIYFGVIGSALGDSKKYEPAKIERAFLERVLEAVDR